jgi:hypothetical protein
MGLCRKIRSSFLQWALEAHNQAVKRLSTGKGNALSIGQRIRELGVKTLRPVPSLVDGLALDDASDSTFEAELGASDSAEEAGLN